MEALAAERKKNGSYKDICEFAARMESKLINKRQLESLAKAGAFDSLSPNRRRFFESASLLVRYNQQTQEEHSSGQDNLFGGMMEGSARLLPDLPQVEEWASAERIEHAFDAIGFYLDTHPLEAWLEELEGTGILTRPDIENAATRNGARVKLAGIVTLLRHRSAGNRRFAHLKLSQPAGSLDISIFDENLIAGSRSLLESRQPLVMQVEVRKDEGGFRLMAESVQRLEDYLNARGGECHIHLSGTRGIQDIRALLGERGKGNGNVCVVLAVGNGAVVELSLGSGYALRPKKIARIATCPQVLEAAIR